MTQYRAFYTATNPDGSRFEGEMVVEARNQQAAKRVAKHYAELWGKQEVRNIQVIDNTWTKVQQHQKNSIIKPQQ